MNRSPKLKNRSGMTAIETAIILVAFVITAAAFTFLVLSAGFLAERSRADTSDGMQDVGSILQVEGDILAECNVTAKKVIGITFYVKLSQGSDPVDMVEDKLMMIYTNPRVNGVIYTYEKTGATTITEIMGDGDDRIEGGERWKITIDFSRVSSLPDFSGKAEDIYTQEYEVFQIEIRSITEPFLTVERVVPEVDEPVLIID